MKKLYVIILMFVISGITFGQVNNRVEVQNNKAKAEAINAKANFLSPLKSSKGPTDTIFKSDFYAAGQPIRLVYGTQAGGYVFGVNNAAGLGSKEIAQGYKISEGGFTQYGIEEVLLFIAGVKKKSVNGSSFTLNICAIDDSSAYTVGTTTYRISCPGTVLSTKTYPWNNMFDTLTKTALATVTLDTTLFVNNDYAVVLKFENYYTNKDTIGLVSSAFGGESFFNGLKYTWWRYPASTDFWALASDVFGGSSKFDYAPGIWPVVDRNYNGIKENTFIDGVMLGQNFPNPADNKCVIEYKIKNTGNVCLEVYNSNGKLVTSINEGKKGAGLYSINLDISKFTSGNYYYSLKCDNNRMTRKMVIVR